MSVELIVSNGTYKPSPQRRVADQLVNGLMQDLVAVGFLVSAVRNRLAAHDPSAVEVLSEIHETIDGDLERLRAVIHELNAAA